jgi:bifunctional DNA-binding transcriptional regulator/antitoxin component of YhaV-PrlF toxin-antitoxin module
LQDVTLAGKIVATSKIFQRGKTQVPSQVRKDLGLQDGDTLVWIKIDEKYCVAKNQIRPLFRETKK